jgi:flagellin
MFNGAAVLNTSGASGAAATIVFQVGANTASGNTLSINLVKIESVDVSGASGGANISTVSGTTAAIAAIDTMIDDVTTARADFGAVQSRFESAINNLQVGMENQAAARGRIMDADFAVETASMTRSQILQQAGNAMVSQANSAPQSVLQLLG